MNLLKVTVISTDGTEHETNIPARDAMIRIAAMLACHEVDQLKHPEGRVVFMPKDFQPGTTSPPDAIAVFARARDFA